MIPRIGQMTVENARSTHGVKIHTSPNARRDDKSAIRTKMQPSGVPSSQAGGAVNSLTGTQGLS
jgi:hypothetical protein